MPLSASTDQTLLLEVIVNGHSSGQIGEFTMRSGMLYVRPQELRDLGFLVPDTSITHSGMIDLDELPGIKWTIDTANQQLIVTASDAILLPTLVQPNAILPQKTVPHIESGTGLTLNYDTVGTFASGQYGGSGSFDLRSFSPWGIANSDWLTYAGTALQTAATKPLVRLDSAYTFADVGTLGRYSVGDYINGGLDWNRPVHMEGFQIRSDFSMRPDLVTFPLPSISGSTAVPSTLDVLVNGNVAASSQVSPGPFEVPQLPVISGAGTITMTLTNTQGQQVTVTQPFYGGYMLLSKGLQTYAGQVGLVRRDWGIVSNEYGKMAGTAYYRRGLTQSFTAEVTAETTPGVFMAGAGGAAVLWNRMMINFDAALSGGSAGAGELLSIGLQHIGTVFSLGGSATLDSRRFRDVAAMNGAPNQRKQLSAFAGITLHRVGTFAVAYAGMSQDPSPVPLRDALLSAMQSHIVTANYELQIGRVFLNATEFRDLDSAGSSGFQFGFTIPLGRRSSASFNGGSNGVAQLEAQQSAANIGDSGYQVYASAGGAPHEFAMGQYKSAVGLFTAGADVSEGQATYRTEAQGAFSLVDRGVFPSNTIYDSFAIVDTAPLKQIHVYQENRFVGMTNKAGRLLVPDMRAFDVNHIGIEPKDIPADADLAFDKTIIRPQDRSGVVVRFPIHFSHGALIKLVDDAGASIPIGSTATVQSTGVLSPVGYDGEAYLENLGPHNKIMVELMNGNRCVATFDYKPVSGDIPTIGPIRCQERKP